eukprot:3328867-Rhodomonas_salina.1
MQCNLRNQRRVWSGRSFSRVRARVPASAAAQVGFPAPIYAGTAAVYGGSTCVYGGTAAGFGGNLDGRRC